MTKAIAAISLMVLTAGCVSDGMGVQTPAYLYSVATLEQMDVTLDKELSISPSKDQRNSYILGKMFVSDAYYARYEQALTRSSDATKFAGSLATIGMSSAAAVLPLGTATHALNATITAVQGAENAIDQDLLQSQAIQSVQRQMRADRDNQAKAIYDRLKTCPVANYPVYLALSDVALYRRYGTLESALVGLGKTTSAVEAAAKANKNSPVGFPAGTAAQDVLTASLVSPPATGSAAIDCPL